MALNGSSSRGVRWICLIGAGAALTAVAIVDRWVTHAKNPSADQWNKMPMPILETHPSDDFFVPARQRFLESYGIHPPSRTVPEVLYIDRQNTDRRLENATHDALLELMQEMAKDGRFEFKHIELEDLTPREQIEVVAYADVSDPPFPEKLQCPFAQTRGLMVGHGGHTRKRLDARNVDAPTVDPHRSASSSSSLMG
jgi:protein O-GlcNAc transferase